MIVPVYKVEMYLKRCVDSILKQTYKDFEIILIDDGSPDQSGVICDTYAKNYLNIYVIHQKNAGLSAARNAGINWSFNNSDSEWITFIDSDDWVHHKYLEYLYNEAYKTSSSIAVCDFIRTKEDKLPEIVEMFPVLKTPEDYYITGGAIVAWGKLYRKELFYDIRFPVGKLHEDEFTTYKLLFQCNHIVVLNQTLYAYFQNENGIMQSQWNPHRLDALDAFEEQIDFFAKRGDFDIARSIFFQLVNRIRTERDKLNYRNFLTNKEKQYCKHRLQKQFKRILIRFRKYKWISLWRRGEDLFVYIDAFPSVRIAHSIWVRIKRAIKKMPYAQWLWSHCKRIPKYRKDISRLCTYCGNMRYNKAVLLQTPLHGNLGDHAIALAEKQILEAVQITTLDYPESNQMERRMASLTSPRKTVLITGGGWLGSLWPNEEERFLGTVEAFDKHRIIVFPQTVFFDMKTEMGKGFFQKSKSVYESHPNLTIFLREKISYDFMKTWMPQVHIELVPDVVMALDQKLPALERNGCLICLRSDKERTISDENRDFLLRIITEKFDNNLRFTDTVLAENIDLEHRDKAVYEKLKEFASAKLVITDRLHGMIFAAITETPCIVFESLSHKVWGCYEWLKDLDYIRLVENVDDILVVICELERVQPRYNRAYIEEAMKPLYDALRGCR